MNDTIYRQEAIDVIDIYMDKCIELHYLPTSDGIKRVISVLPSARQWIPVSERLPEDSSPVLVTHRDGVSYGWYNGTYFERGASTNHRKLQTVVAWMPLPEPYRGEGEK